MPIQTNKWRVAIGIALLGLTPLIAFDEGQRYWRLWSDEATATAVVTKLERRQGRKQLFARYYASYEFTDLGGKRRTGRQQISDDLYEVLAASPPDRQVVVHYWRPDPNLNVISLRALRNEFLLVGCIALVVVALILAWFIVERREKSAMVEAVRRRMLLDEGRRRQLASAPVARWLYRRK